MWYSFGHNRMDGTLRHNLIRECMNIAAVLHRSSGSGLTGWMNGFALSSDTTITYSAVASIARAFSEAHAVPPARLDLILAYLLLIESSVVLVKAAVSAM